MPKLHELLAVEGQLKGQAQATRTELRGTFETNARVRVIPPGAADETRQTEAGTLTLAHEFAVVMVQHRGELSEWPVQARDVTEAHAQFVAWWNGLQPAPESLRRRGMDV